MSSTVCFIPFYRKTRKYALNVLAGALASNPRTTDVEIVYANNPSELCQAIGNAQRKPQRPVVAWSYYSPGFVESAELLEAIKRQSPRDTLHIAGGVHATAEPEQGFIANVDFLLGLPGETEQDVKRTRRFAEELATLGARIHSHTFMPLPATPMYSAEAGQVDAETGSLLTQLESQGSAWGSWRQQQKVAKELVILRSRD